MKKKEYEKLKKELLKRVNTLSKKEEKIIKRVEYLEPDIIHVHDLPNLRIGASIKKQLNIPLIYDAHEFYPEQPRLTKEDKWYLKILETKYIKFPDKIITVNKMLAKIMKKIYKLKKVYDIQNATVAPINFDINKKYDLFREKLNYPIKKDQVILLYQGWISNERNLETIIEGMSLLESDVFVLIIMGYGDYVNKLNEIKEKLNLKNIYFAPKAEQEELLFYTASADIGVIPYPHGKDLNTHYVSPNKLYEFISAGLPILSNNLPFIEEIINEYDFGICFDMNTPESFSKNLQKFLFLDPFLREKKKNVIKRGKYLSWEKESKKFLEIYKDFLINKNIDV